MTIEKLKEKLYYRLENTLLEMESGYDDSVTGFDIAWDIMRSVFDEYSKEAQCTARCKLCGIFLSKEDEEQKNNRMIDNPKYKDICYPCMIEHVSK